MGCGPSLPCGFQAALERFNPRLRVRWNAERDLWVIEERGRTDGVWYYVLFWADRDEATGALRFRRLPETPGPIIERLVQIDVARFERSPRSAWRSLVQQMDGERKRYIEAHLSRKQDTTKQRIKSLWRHHITGRRSFDMGAAHIKAKSSKPIRVRRGASKT